MQIRSLTPKLSLAALLAGCPESDPSQATDTAETEETTAASTNTASESTTESTGEPDDEPCTVVADCIQGASPCRVATACTAGFCVFSEVDDGTPLDAQLDGDCAQEVCDGAGGTRLEATDDPPDDGILCTLDQCDGMTPTHVPGMAPCYSGPRGTEGVGLCRAGVQTCDNSGMPTGPCIGEVQPIAEACDPGQKDEDCDGEVNESGEACICAPGSTQPCYSGPMETLDVGVCVGGQQTCDASGLAFGGCEGEVVPADEECDADANDEDCDGLINESGAACTCGDGFLSEGEACDDGNLVDGDGCSAACLAPLTVVEIAGGGAHACALLSDGQVKCWGKDGGGHGNDLFYGDEPDEMGDNLPFTDLGEGQIASVIAIGRDHSCAILGGGKVKCWGHNSYGQLGLGDTKSRGYGPNEMGNALPFVDLGAGRVAVALSLGQGHSCAVFADGDAKCWGANWLGILGQEDIEFRGDEPGEMGDSLLPIDFGAGRKVVMLDAAPNHNCAILDDETLKCWGSGQYGALGLEDGKYRGYLPGDMGDNLPPVKLGVGKKPIAVDCGADHTCAVLNGGLLKCWGANGSGQNGSEQQAYIGKGPNSMGDNLSPVKLGAGAFALDVAANEARTCVLLNGGTVKCWGQSYLGFTGANIGRFAGSMGDNLPTIDLGVGQVALDVVGDGAGGGSGQANCVLLEGGLVKCWGYSYASLGQGHTMSIGASEADMGDNLPPIEL